MRSEIFLVGIAFVVMGPVITAFALSSCLGTILSGHFLACVTDFAYLIIGGAFFVVGIIMALVGVFAPDPPPTPPLQALNPPSSRGPNVTCKKCGRAFASDLFFCPSCGQRQS